MTGRGVAADRAGAGGARPEGSRAAARTWAGRLVGADAAESRGRDAARLLAGLGLAAVYGIAIGARQGGGALLANALGVPLAVAAVYLVAVPAFFIVLAMLDVPVALERVAAVAARAAASTGLVLAGLAPAGAVFATTSASQSAAAATAAAGLALAGGVGLLQLREGLVAASERADSATRGLVALATIGFAVFAAVLAARVWWGAVPALDVTREAAKVTEERGAERPAASVGGARRAGGGS